VAVLKTTHSDGDVFYAGITTDTDKLNGIATQINTDTLGVAEAIGFIETIFGDIVGSDIRQIQLDTSVDETTNVDNTNTTALWAGAGLDRWYFCDLIDNLDDSSIDASLWSNSGAVENTDSLTITSAGGTEYIYLDGASAPDLNQASECSLFWRAYVDTGAGTANFILQIADESAHVVTIKNQSENWHPGTELWEIRVRPGDNELDVYHDEVSLVADVDVSALTDGDAWHIRLTVTGTGASVIMYTIGWIGSSTASADLITETQTADSNSQGGFLFDAVDSDTSNGGTHTPYYSSDIGANYVSGTFGKRISTADYPGTGIKFKINGTSTANTRGTWTKGTVLGVWSETT